MDTTMITVLVTGFGTMLLTVTATAGLVMRSIGNLRRHMDARFDALARSDQEGYDMICRKLDDFRREIRLANERERARSSNRPVLSATDAPIWRTTAR